MKVARYYDAEDIRLEEAPMPGCGSDEIIVKSMACGICSGELMDWYMRSKAPFVFGHEPAGVVVEVGARVADFHVGDRVFMHHHAPCFVCRDCRRGSFVMCETWKRSKLDPGGMAEYVRVPGENLKDTLHLPPQVDWAGGALVEPLACAVQALERSRIRSGDVVLVIGLGIMGQLLAKAAWAYGAGTVLGADFHAGRRRMAQALGASDVLDPGAGPLSEQVSDMSRGRRADVVLVGPPFIQAMEDGISCAGKGATVVLFSPAPPGERLAIEPHDLYFRDVALVPSYSCGPTDTRRALALLASGAVQSHELITHCYSFSDVAAGYRAMKSGGDVVKVLIEFPGARSVAHHESSERSE